jgi:hypothetical protein
MLVADIIEWIKTEFQPLTLATPDATLEQCVNNGIRFWNTHSGYKITLMVDYVPAEKRVLLSKQIKSVIHVLPCSKTTWIWNDNPLWTMMGVTVLDNVTNDLIMMSEAFRNYKIYVGTDMRWQFEKSEDPSQGGYLYIINVPSNVTRLAVVGTKRIVADEDIKVDYILEWLLSYVKALVKQVEGNTLRKAGVVGIKNDGQELVTEGATEAKELQERLKKDGRWTAMSFRG